MLTSGQEMTHLMKDYDYDQLTFIVKKAVKMLLYHACSKWKKLSLKCHSIHLLLYFVSIVSIPSNVLKCLESVCLLLVI